MSSIKLTADSGGGTFELKAPASGSNARVLTIPDESATLLTSATSTGKILQVQQTVGTGTYSTNSQTYGDVITCAITPASTSNKIICIYKIGLSTANGGYSGAARLVRDSTAIYVGNAAGNRIQASSHFVADSYGIGNVKIFDQA